MISLKPQDVFVLLKLSLQPQPPTLAGLASALGMSASEVHGALNRSAAAALLDYETRRPKSIHLLEFLEHGIRYVFVPRRGEITRGVPTASSAPPLDALLRKAGPFRKMFGGSQETGPGPIERMFTPPPLVWPHPEGQVRGEGLEPLYPSAVEAALRDRSLYECLALVDAIRVGRARERTLAIDLLRKRIRSS